MIQVDFVRFSAVKHWAERRLGGRLECQNFLLLELDKLLTPLIKRCYLIQARFCLDFFQIFLRLAVGFLGDQDRLKLEYLVWLKCDPTFLGHFLLNIFQSLLLFMRRLTDCRLLAPVVR